MQKARRSITLLNLQSASFTMRHADLRNFVGIFVMPTHTDLKLRLMDFPPNDRSSTSKSRIIELTALLQAHFAPLNASHRPFQRVTVDTLVS
jgi:hypothetical protein